MRDLLNFVLVAECPTCKRFARKKGHPIQQANLEWKCKPPSNSWRHTTRFGRAYHKMAKKAENG